MTTAPPRSCTTSQPWSRSTHATRSTRSSTSPTTPTASRPRWSAERVEPEDFRGDSQLLTGEHLFPWHFEDAADLQPYREVADIVAEQSWPKLYDAGVLAEVDVPCAASIYADDPFVDRQFSEQTADLLPGMRRWLTDEYLHNGLRTGGDHVLDRLIGLAHGTI